MPAADEYLPRLRRRLLLDAADPIFTGPLFIGEEGNARKKLQELTTAKSEGAVTWNVFRTFEKLPSETWLPALLREAECTFDGLASPLTVEYWQTVAPSKSRLLWLLDHLDSIVVQDPRQEASARTRIERVAEHTDRWRNAITDGTTRGDGVFEGSVELDAVLSTPDAIIGVMVRATSDVQVGTQWDASRDEIGRALDAVLDLTSDGRQPYFLFVTDDYKHPGVNVVPMAYESLMPRYRIDPAYRASKLPHRTPDELARLDGHIGWLSLADMVDAVLDHSSSFPQPSKRMLINLVDYLHGRRLLHKGG